ncbi:MAG: DUF721 domain-containing protein [Rhizobiaceae bacterium]|nr:DUF721 domain-containing protein [Rhizobiaceae bacterium]
MAGPKSFPQPVADLATEILDPLLRRRAGMSVALVQSWDEIAGPRLSGITRPERVVWPRRHGEDDLHEPATLVIACSGAAALRVQHETGEIVGRVNAFLGYGAIGRVKIVQKPVEPGKPALREPRRLTPAETERIANVTAGVEDDGLKEALARLGAGIARKTRKL